MALRALKGPSGSLPVSCHMVRLVTLASLPFFSVPLHSSRPSTYLPIDHRNCNHSPYPLLHSLYSVDSPSEIDKSLPVDALTSCARVVLSAPQLLSRGSTQLVWVCFAIGGFKTSTYGRTIYQHGYGSCVGLPTVDAAHYSNAFCACRRARRDPTYLPNARPTVAARLAPTLMVLSSGTLSVRGSTSPL